MAHFNLAATFQKVNFVNVHVGESVDLVLVGTGPEAPSVRLWPIPFEDRTANVEVLHGLADKMLPPFRVPNWCVEGRDVLLKVTGRNPGNCMLFAREGSFANPPVAGDRDWGETQIVVALATTDTADLVYTGAKLTWKNSLPPSARGKGQLVFDATSGGRGRQVASDDKLLDVGPIPQGLFSFLAEFDPLQASEAQANTQDDAFKNTREGIQALPTRWDSADGIVASSLDWGTWRVRLNPQGQTPGRTGGFYLHDSHKGYTSGCIEIGPFEGRTFFDFLREYARDPGKPKRRLVLHVIYGDPNAPTKGDTQR
jgi:hypothetical protein